MSTSSPVKSFGLILALLVLVSDIQSIPSHNFLRIRRDAEAEPEPEPATTASTGSLSSPMSVTVPSSSASSSSPSLPGVHASHSIKCVEDPGSLKESCPDENTCPSDNKTMEQCCHCLNLCCDSMMGMDGDGPTSEPETSTNSTGKGIGNKVKDAVNSAEGWIKNAGQNIKNSWDKAKEGIKQTATDVKDKVKKGINSVANKMRNGTSSDDGSRNMSGDCREKDGKCSTDMTTGDNTSSTESSEEAGKSSTMPTTNTPGYRKMKKRDLYGANRSPYSSYSYGSSPMYGTGTRYNSGVRNFDNDDSDSNEVSWTKTTRTQTGSRDFNRRYTRESGMRDSTDHPNAENSTTVTTASSTSTARKTSGGQRYRRDHGSRSSSTNTTSDAPASDATSMPEKSGRSGGATEKRNKRSPSMMQSTTTTPSMEGTASPKDNSKSRTRREANYGKGGSTYSSDTSKSTEGAGVSAEDDSEEEDYKHGSWGNKDRSQHNSGNSGGSRSNSSFSISVHMTGPPQETIQNESFSSSKSSASTNGQSATASSTGSARASSGGNGPIRFPYDDRSLTFSTSYEQTGTQMDHPPITYPGGNGGGGMSSPSNHRPNYEVNSRNSSTSVHSSTGNHNGFYGNGIIRGSGSGKNGIGTMGGPYYQEFPSQEYSQYYPILEKATTEMTTSSSSWLPSGSGGWGSSNWGSGSSGDSKPCNDDQGDQQHHHHHAHDHHHHHHNSQDCHNDHHFHITSQNEEEGLGGGTLDSGSFGDDNNGHGYYPHHHNGDGQNNNVEPSQHGNHHHHHHHQHQEHNQSNHNKNEEQYQEENADSTWPSGVVSSGDAERGTPGVCRPLAGGAKCASLRADSAECLYDTDCSGTKKCCFYNCDPYKTVGICEHVTYTVTKP